MSQTSRSVSRTKKLNKPYVVGLFDLVLWCGHEMHWIVHAIHNQLYAIAVQLVQCPHENANSM